VDKKGVKIVPEQICLNDPLVRLLLRASRQSGVRTAFMAFVIYSVLIVGGGWGISALYGYSSQHVLPIWDRREIIPALFVNLLVAPLVWAFYVWEPVRILEMFRELAQNNVIGQSKRKYADSSAFLNKERAAFNKKIWFILVITVLTVFSVNWLSLAFNTHNTFYFGFQLTWWQANPFYFWIVWFPLTFVNYYMVLWIITRKIITIFTVNKLFDSFEVIPQLLHPDKANGFGSIGKYSTRLSFLTMLLAIWLSFFIVYPIFLGKPINLKSDTIFLLIVYIIFIPVSLLLPVWPTHAIMRKAKFQSLEERAKPIRQLLASKEYVLGLLLTSLSPLLGRIKESHRYSDVTELLTLIEALKREYRDLEKEYHTWPFNIPDVRNFILTTLAPLFWIIVSLVVKKVFFP